MVEVVDGVVGECMGRCGFLDGGLAKIEESTA